MKIILKNTDLTFERDMQKVSINSYDAFGATVMGATGNIAGVDASASDKRAKMYNVSEFAGKKLFIKVYFNYNQSSYTDANCVAFFTTAKTHEDVNDNNILIADNGCLTTAGMNKKWGWNPSVPPASVEVTAEITIPSGTVAMGIVAGTAEYTGVSYPNNSEVYYYE